MKIILKEDLAIGNELKKIGDEIDLDEQTILSLKDSGVKFTEIDIRNNMIKPESINKRTI